MALEYTLPLTVSDIEKIIPHRSPFLLVDRVIDLQEGKSIVGSRDLSEQDSFFKGHFPGKPTMPNTLILEALAQLGAIYANIVAPERLQARGAMIYFTGLEDATFGRAVVPGDTLRLELSNCIYKLGHWKMAARATVNGEMVATATIKAAEAR